MLWLDIPFLIALSVIAWCGLQLLRRRDFGLAWAQVGLTIVFALLMWGMLDRYVSDLPLPLAAGWLEIAVVVAKWFILVILLLYLVLRLVLLVHISAKWN